MIQRIQSIYLFLAGIFSAISIFFPIENVIGWLLTGGVISLLSWVIIFLFRNRLRQHTYTTCLLWATVLYLGGYIAQMVLTKTFSWTILLPLLTLVLVYLARKAIWRDEEKIRAAERIR